MASSDAGLAILDAAAKKAKLGGPRFPRIWMDDATTDGGGDYLVKGLLDRGRLAVVYGPPGDGKTFWTIDLSAHVATDTPWRGRKVHPGAVIYIASEAGVSIARRFVAWREHMLGEAREGRIPLCILTRGANLLNAVDVKALLVELREIAAEAGVPLALVVFDTLSRSMAGGDENSSKDVTCVIAAADAIREDLGATVLVVHHTGKDLGRGARGHSSLVAAADTVVAVVDRVATVEKVRDGTAGERFAFALEVVSLGEDADGDSMTTCIVRPEEEGNTPGRKPKLTGVARIGLAALEEIIHEKGRAMPETSTIPGGVRAVEIAEWRARFALRYGTDGDGTERDRNAIKAAFRRAREQLARADLVGMSDPYAWTR